MIILDFGSANTCRNNYNYVRRMITELARLEPQKEVIIKWQLFESAPPNARLSRSLFDKAYVYARSLGFKTTASVFDVSSLDFLHTFDIPFVKIANNKASSSLIPLCKIKTIQSVDSADGIIYTTEKPYNNDLMFVVSDYPADKQLYIDKFGDLLQYGLSDHTEDFELYNTHQPLIYECHYKLEDSQGLDAGPFARTPMQLKDILK